MKPSADLLKLKTYFDAGDYDKVIEQAEKQLSSPQAILYARLICAAHIKNEDSESLDEFIKDFIAKNENLKDQLEFERAYADFSNKRDASWFLKSNTAHPRASVLKSQIQYRKYEFYSAAQNLIKYNPQNQDTITNMLAFASRSNSNVSQKYLNMQSESYEYYYNLSLYQFSHCQFSESLTSIQKAKSLFEAQESEDQYEKDRLNIRLLTLICESYSNKTSNYYISEEPEAIQPYLKILSWVQSLKFTRPDYQQMIDLSNQLIDLDKLLKNYQLPEQSLQSLKILQATVRTLIKPLSKISQKNNNFSQFQLSGLIFAFLAQNSLPTIQIQRRFKKTPLLFTEFQRVKMTQRQVQVVESELYSEMDQKVKNNAVTLLKSFAAFSDLVKFDQKYADLVIMQNLYYNQYKLAKLEYKSKTVSKQEIQVQLIVKDKVKKPMPAKWIRKIKRGKKVQHQGQYLAGDKTEISHVAPKKIVPKKGRR
ncbi:Putative_TPR-like repeat-containing protein [Hexamita inflata]|uniref:TPR-like repeat-containing protein n=1 Tax=Hexamita inflata TaxID=28002 RepID=A0AA86TZN9_9EUKA|nr:Putative TPR-like repeat-containing protein [Hexamita inflata]